MTADNYVLGDSHRFVGHSLNLTFCSILRGNMGRKRCPLCFRHMRNCLYVCLHFENDLDGLYDARV